MVQTIQFGTSKRGSIPSPRQEKLSDLQARRACTTEKVLAEFDISFFVSLWGRFRSRHWSLSIEVSLLHVLPT